MREIKFRAKKGNGWIYFSLQQLIDGNAENFKEYSLAGWCEYTGLKDKNCTEIYESDLLLYEGDLYKVFYNADRFGFDLVSIPIETNKAWLYPEDVFFDESEVVGNIYENPELLGS